MLFSVFNTQRSTNLNLGRVGTETNEAIDFHSTSKGFSLGADTLPHDGSPLRVSFNVPSGMQQTMDGEWWWRWIKSFFAKPPDGPEEQLVDSHSLDGLLRASLDPFRTIEP